MDNYCEDALKLLGKKVQCGKKCPKFDNCLRLIIEDVFEEATEEIIKRYLFAEKTEGK